MKRSTLKVALLSLMISVLLAGGLTWVLMDDQDSGVKAVERVRLELKAAGFKTDLKEFDLGSTSEAANRSGSILAYQPAMMDSRNLRASRRFIENAEDAGIVFWQLPWPRTEDGEILWPVLHEKFETEQFELAQIAEQLSTGPIRFELQAEKGRATPLPHLAAIRKLSDCFGDGMLLALHEGQPTVAWTNLLGKTRLVTGWEVEPIEISQLFWLNNVQDAFTMTWQALQSHGFTEPQLDRLQTEWAKPDFFKKLPEAVAFQRASMLAFCEQYRREPLRAGFSGASAVDLVKELINRPGMTLRGMNEMWKESRYQHQGIYADEIELLRFLQQREIATRSALTLPDWRQIQGLPGATNQAEFISKSNPRISCMLSLRGGAMGSAWKQMSPLARAARAESSRRILITAIALERFRLRHGNYPTITAELAPEFLKNVPVDFMDGQPLRYQLRPDGNFVLYSVGLDGMDDGGKLPDPGTFAPRGPGGLVRNLAMEKDIVWPRPATPEEAAAALEAQRAELATRFEADEEAQTTESWKQADELQTAFTNHLTQKLEIITNEPEINGIKLGDLVQNFDATGTNRLRLDELLTLTQVITGDEPERVTFELPIHFDALPDPSALQLIMDDSQGILPEVQECLRATNGNCRLVWHAYFSNPGTHGLQAKLEWETPASGIPTPKSKRSGFSLPPMLRGQEIIFGPPLLTTNANLCQLSSSSATYDVERGALFRGRLPEPVGNYEIECTTTNGVHLKTLSGSTDNGAFKVVWDLVDDHGGRLNGETFNETIKISLPTSGRTQILRGP